MFKDRRNWPSLLLLATILTIWTGAVAQQGNQVIPASGGSSITYVTTNPVTFTTGQIFYNTVTSQFLCATSNTVLALCPTTQQDFPIFAGSICPTISTPHCFFVNDDTHFVTDASITVTGANPTLTCPGNDCLFTSTDSFGRPIAKTGQLVYAICTTDPNGIQFFGSSTSTLMLGSYSTGAATITTINGAESITTSGTGAGCGAGKVVLVWGDDDTANLTAFTNAVAASCGVGQMAAGAMLTSRGQFNKTPIGCTQAYAEFKGLGQNSTSILPLPNFDFTTGTGNSCQGIGPNSILGLNVNTAVKTCFGGAIFTSYDNFGILGMGQNNPNPSSEVFLFGVYQGYIHDVKCGQWMAGGGNNAWGMLIYFDTFYPVSNINSDGCGAVGNAIVGGGSAPLFNPLEVIQISGSEFVDNGGAPQSGTCTSAKGVPGCSNLLINDAYVSSHGNFFGYNLQPFGAAVELYGLSSGSQFHSFGDYIWGCGAQNNTNTNYGFNFDDSLTEGDFTNDIFSACSLTQNGLQEMFFVRSGLTGTRTIKASGNYFINQNAGYVFDINSTGTSVYDLGGNTSNDTAHLSTGASATFFGSSSATGVVPVVGNVVLTSGWGTSTVTSISGDSHRLRFAISVTGAPGAGPVLTVTFPSPFYVAPASCGIQEVSGTFGIITNPSVGVPTATTVAVTFSGTPVATNTYTFDLACGP